VNIGFDAKRYFHNQSGLGNYSRDLINSLIQCYPNNQFFLFDKSTQAQTEDNKHIIRPSRAKLLWREFGIIKDIIQSDLNVYHGLSNELPFGKWPNQIKRVVTIHDVIFKTLPDKYPLIDRSIYHFKTLNALKKADRIIATSEHTFRQLAQFYPLDKRKVDIVYQTCASEFWIKHTENDLESFKNKYQLSKPFLLYVSTFNQRKNHHALIQSFNKINRKDIQLVLAGQKGDTFQQTNALVNQLGLSNDILFLPNFNQQELPLLYQSAKAFVYPSLSEGFGIPLLEAMVSGLPILASDLEVFREIANSDVLFFDLKSDKDFIDKLNLLLELSPLDYSSHVLKFNRDEIAHQVMNIYKS
jgi:glycosyltransferase involved in cell wall biosynthesis